MNISNKELIEISRHSSQSIDAVVRVYNGGCSARIRDRVKASEDILGLESPPGRDIDPETAELNFDE